MKCNRKFMNVLCTLLVGVLMLSFASCDSLENKEDSNNQAMSGSTDSSTDVPSASGSATIAIAENVRYSATSAEQIKNPEYDARYSFYDDDYYYYVFYLGCIDHVPLQNNASVYEYIGQQYEKEISTSVTNETMISQMVSQAESTCVTHSVDASVKGTFGDDFFGPKIEVGLSVCGSRAHTTSREQSYSTASSYSETNAETTKFAFTDASKIGYYRYVLFGDIDVFGVLVKDIDSGDYYTDTYEIVAAQYFSLDYSETSRFNDNNYQKLVFSLTREDADSLSKPSVFIGDRETGGGSDSVDINTVVTYDSGYSAKKIDASYEYTYDVFDLSELSAFMNSGYTLHFNVQVYMREENKGFQEIYVCKDDETHVAGTDAYEYGGAGKANTSYSWVTFDWDVNGSNCTPTMKLRYGAHGEHSDDWWRAHVKVTVTVD